MKLYRGDTCCSKLKTVVEAQGVSREQLTDVVEVTSNRLKNSFLLHFQCRKFQTFSNNYLI